MSGCFAEANGETLFIAETGEPPMDNARDEAVRVLVAEELALSIGEAGESSAAIWEDSCQAGILGSTHDQG